MIVFLGLFVLVLIFTFLKNSRKAVINVVDPWHATHEEYTPAPYQKSEEAVSRLTVTI